MTEFDSAPIPLSPEQQLRETILARTIAPLIAAKEVASRGVDKQISDALTARYQAQRQGVSFDRVRSMHGAAQHAIDAALLDARIQEITGIIAGASTDELSDVTGEFDPYKARYVAETVGDIMATSGITEPKKYARHTQRVSLLAAAEYDRAPLQPYPDHDARRALERRSKGLVGWAVGSLLDRI